MLWLASLLALAAAALFGFNVHIHRKGLDGVGGMTGAFLSVASMAVAFWIFAPFFIEWEWFSRPGTLIFALAGIFFPAMGQSLQIIGVQRVGPALTSALGATAPIFAVFPAVLILGEAFGLQAAIALALMVGGLILSALPRKGFTRNWPLWALLIPLGASAVRGLSQPAVKQGLQTVPSPFFSALITASVSTLVLAVIVAIRRRQTTGPKPAPNMRAVGWFVVSGIINGLGILSINSALSLGDVTMVAPLVATAPLWALLFGWVIFRRETLTWRHLMIASLVVAGAVLLVLR